MIKIHCVGNTIWGILKAKKGRDTMALMAQEVKNTNFNEVEYSEKSAVQALYDELAKGIQSVKNGDVYTIEEAWEEIDKI